MIPLIDENDINVLKKEDGLKKASFYKDMMAFYDAYSYFISNEEFLPNYCIIDGEYYLDGILLLIKDYSSEFEFETLNLTLDYLKILYYSIAKYSDNEFLPEKEIIESEFELRKKTSDEISKKATKLLENEEIGYDISSENYEKLSESNKKLSLKIKSITKKSIFQFLITLVCSALIFGASYPGFLEKKLSIIISSAVLFVGLICFIILQKKKKNLSKKLSNDNNQLQRLKFDKNEKYSSYEIANEKNRKINKEIYDYIRDYSNLSILKSNSSLDKIKQKLKRTNILSYNLKNDIILTFESHENDINDIVEQINEQLNNGASLDTFSEIYLKIMGKDWLYYNNLVRFCFIDKFVDCAKTTNKWKLNVNDKFINPFDIKIKKIMYEKVAFLPENYSQFIEISINTLLNSGYVKNNLEPDFGGNIEEMKKFYENKFYNFEQVSDFSNFFIDFKNKENKERIDKTLISDKKIIPALFYIKEKKLEFSTKTEVSNMKIIDYYLEKIMSNSVNNDFDNDSENDFVINSALDEEFVCENVEHIDKNCTKYSKNGKNIIGFKI